MPDILIIAVIYNTYDEAKRFLKSIDQQKYDKLHIVLVDNSDKTEHETFKNSLNNYSLKIDYIKNSYNAGYFGGAEIGWSAYLKKNTIPQWIIVSNVDILFNQENFFEKIQNLKITNDTGVIAPAIISTRWKTDANPKIVKRYSLQKLKFYRMLYTFTGIQNTYILLSYLKKIFQNGLQGLANKVTEKERHPVQYIYAPHGSCIIFRKTYFEKGGNLSHISFLFGEEIFVAETCLNLGLKVAYIPFLLVDDEEHASTGIFYSRKIAGYMKQSTIDIINHYYKRK